MKEKLKSFWQFISSKESVFVILAMMFAGALVTSNVVAFKMFSLGWHWFDKGGVVAFNVGTFCYAITLLISNTVSYKFGSTKAKYLIAGGFAAQILSTVLIIALRYVPGISDAAQETYVSALGQNWAMVIGSLSGYLFCQIANYLVFNRLLKKVDNWKTKGVWNFVANIFGQLLDTIVFDLVAFGIFNAAGGYACLWQGGALSLIDMILFTWLFKIVVAAVYTLVFYLLTIKREKDETVDAER